METKNRRSIRVRTSNTHEAANANRDWPRRLGLLENKGEYTKARLLPANEVVRKVRLDIGVLMARATNEKWDATSASTGKSEAIIAKALGQISITGGALTRNGQKSGVAAVCTESKGLRLQAGGNIRHFGPQYSCVGTTKPWRPEAVQRIIVSHRSYYSQHAYKNEN